MAHQADSYGIKIRDAAAWARAENGRLAKEALELPKGSDIERATTMHAVAFSVIANVLEEVVEPGCHSRKPGWSMVRIDPDQE